MIGMVVGFELGASAGVGCRFFLKFDEAAHRTIALASHRAASGSISGSVSSDASSALVFELLGLTVDDQVSDGGAIVDGAGRSYARIRPDLVVSLAGHPLLVIDAKYKDYGLADTVIGNGDVYQLFFYASRLQARESLPSAPLTMIVSPARIGECVPLAARRLHLVGGVDEQFELKLALPDLESMLASLDRRDSGWLKEARNSLLSGNSRLTE